MNKPWRKFSEELPNDYSEIEILENSHIWTFKTTAFNRSYFVRTTDLENIISGEPLSDLSWRYNQDGWLYPEEVTGDEDADYYIVWTNEGTQVIDSMCLQVNRISSFSELFKTAEKNYLVKPMKFEQPPKWMME